MFTFTSVYNKKCIAKCYTIDIYKEGTEKYEGRFKVEKKKRSGLDKLILVVVVIVAGVVVALSFTNTAKLAKELGLQPLLTAGLVELLFASLLFIRARQRATRRNVPRFLSTGYFMSLGFVTGVNMWGLSLENPTIGPIVGGAISAAMWLMESVLVWLWIDSHRPHQKSLRELKKEAKARRKAARLSQEIEWMDWLAQKPDMALVRKARREEEKRLAIVAEGLPVFFDQVEIGLAETATNHTDEENGRQNGHRPAAETEQQPATIPRTDQRPADREAATPTTTYSTATTAQNDRPKVADAKERPVTNKPAANQPAEEKKPADKATVDQMPKKVVDKKTETKSGQSKVTTIRQVTDEEVFQVAVQYYRENGREPGQRELARLAGCSRHRANKALTQLEREIKEEAI